MEAVTCVPRLADALQAACGSVVAVRVGWTCARATAAGTGLTVNTAEPWGAVTLKPM